MIKTYLFTDKQISEDVAIDDWRGLVEDGCKLLWVDVRSVTKEDMETLRERFGLHDISVASCLDRFTRPHVYEFEDHLFVNMTAVSRGGNHGVKASELNLFAGGNFVITVVKEKTSEAVDKALKEFKETPRLCSRGGIYAVYLLAEDLVETYFPVVEKLDSEADKLEDDMLNKADKQSLHRLFAIKRRVFELRRLLGPQRDIFNDLSRRDFPFVAGENQVYFQDAYGRMNRIFDMVDTVREILSGSLDIYLSSVSNRLNEIMKVLTVASIILMILSFITGFYGMNFVHIPWLQSPNAVRNTLISMGVITGGMLWWFRRIRWI